MPLPYRAGVRRKVALWRSFEISDPSFDAPVKVALRPLLDTEIDIADEASAEFVRKHLTGGWTDDDGRFQKEPQPIFIEGKPVALAESTVGLMHRYEAMQEPMPGMRPRPEGCAAVDVAEMVEAASGRAEEFWKGLQLHAGEVWSDGSLGKGWADGSSEPPTGSSPSASST